MFIGAFSWLGAATPVWLSILLVAALGVVAWQLWAIVRRMDRHAQSIAHMDEWADVVDHSLARLEERSRRPVAPAPNPSMRPAAAPAQAPRSTADLKRLWQK